ncbi:hypothetical protein D9M70_617360 [compost metagenome]
MADNGIDFFRHQGNRQAPGTPQRVDDELLGVARVPFAPEGGFGESGNGLDIVDAFIANTDVHADLLAGVRDDCAPR